MTPRRLPWCGPSLPDHPTYREDTGDPGSAGDRFLVLAEVSGLTVARADGTPLAASVPATPDGARTVVARLEHLTRWHLIKRLDNPVSTIAGQVSLEIVPAERSERPPLPGQRAPLTAGKDESSTCLTGRPPSAGSTPYVFIYLHNNSDRDLYCALLDMTDRYRCHSRLFPGDLIPAGKTAVAYEGRPIDISVPQQRLDAGGADVYDWLKLIAAEQRFASDGYKSAQPRRLHHRPVSCPWPGAAQHPRPARRPCGHPRRRRRSDWSAGMDDRLDNGSHLLAALKRTTITSWIEGSMTCQR